MSFKGVLGGVEVALFTFSILFLFFSLCVSVYVDWGAGSSLSKGERCLWVRGSVYEVLGWRSGVAMRIVLIKGTQGGAAVVTRCLVGLGVC